MVGAFTTGTHKLTCRLRIVLIGLVKRKKFKFSVFVLRFAILNFILLFNSLFTLCVSSSSNHCNL